MSLACRRCTTRAESRVQIKEPTSIGRFSSLKKDPLRAALRAERKTTRDSVPRAAPKDISATSLINAGYVVTPAMARIGAKSLIATIFRE